MEGCACSIYARVVDEYRKSNEYAQRMNEISNTKTNECVNTVQSTCGIVFIIYILRHS